MFVPPPTNSLLGGGSVRIAERKITGNDENALLGSINHLNAAAGTRAERRYVVSAISKATGGSERELQAQQEVQQFRFGELCAINAIARGDINKVQEIATVKARGRTWTQLANSNGLSIASVVRTTRNADETTVASYSNAMEGAKGGQDKLKSIGAHPQRRPELER